MRFWANDDEYEVVTLLSRSPQQEALPVPHAQHLLRQLWWSEPERSLLRGLVLAEHMMADGTEPDSLALELLLDRVERSHILVRRTGTELRNIIQTLGSEAEEAEGEGETSTDEDHYIQIQVIDDDGAPVPNVPYELTLPDHRVVRGRTNDYGVIHMAGLDPGTCKLTLPEHDREAWEAA